MSEPAPDDWRFHEPWPDRLAAVAHRAVTRPGGPSRRVHVVTDRWLPDGVGTWHVVGDALLGERPALTLRDDPERGTPVLGRMPVPPFDVFRAGAGFPGLRHTEFRFRLRVAGWFGRVFDMTFTFRDGLVASVDHRADNDLMIDTTFEALVAVHVSAVSWRDAFSTDTRYVGKQAALMFGIGFVEQLPRQVIPPARAGVLVDVATALGSPWQAFRTIDTVDAATLPSPREAQIALVEHASGPTAVVSVRAGDQVLRATSADPAAAEAWAAAVAGEAVEIDRFWPPGSGP